MILLVLLIILLVLIIAFLDAEKLEKKKEQPEEPIEIPNPPPCKEKVEDCTGVACPNIREELLLDMVQGSYGDVDVVLPSKKQDALSAVWRSAEGQKPVMVVMNTQADVEDWNPYEML